MVNKIVKICQSVIMTNLKVITLPIQLSSIIADQDIYIYIYRERERERDIIKFCVCEMVFCVEVIEMPRLVPAASKFIRLKAANF